MCYFSIVWLGDPVRGFRSQCSRFLIPLVGVLFFNRRVRSGWTSGACSRSQLERRRPTGGLLFFDDRLAGRRLVESFARTAGRSARRVRSVGRALFAVFEGTFFLLKKKESTQRKKTRLLHYR